MLRFLFQILATVIVSTCCLIGVALGQAANDAEYYDVDLGDRNVGEQYVITIGASNSNCDQAIDFKFSSKAPWINFPEDSVVRQVQPGQNRTIQIGLDFSNMQPGTYEAIVDIDCENCGVLIFKNCSVSQKRVRLKVNLIGTASLEDNIQLSELDSPNVDYDDKRIPWRLRNAAKSAHGAWAAAVKKANDCVEELAALKTKVTKATEAANAAKMLADTADQDVRNMKAQNEAGQTELLNANKAARDAKEAVKTAESELDNALTHEREAARANLEAKKAEQAAADKRLSDAGKNARPHSNRDIRQQEQDAREKRKAAEKAKKAQDKAWEELNKKRKECGELSAEAEKARQANAKAEADAKAVIPPPPSPPTQSDIDAANERLKKCATELGQLLEAQRLALEAMAKLGGMGDGYQSDLELWGDAVDDANDVFDRFPPGTPFVGAVQDSLTLVRAVIGIARGVRGLGNTVHRPKNGNDTVSPEETQKWLQSNGFANDGPEAKRVYEQMKKYSAPSPNSTKDMRTELDYKRQQCKKLENALDEVTAAVAKNN